MWPNHFSIFRFNCKQTNTIINKTSESRAKEIQIQHFVHTEGPKTKNIPAVNSWKKQQIEAQSRKSNWSITWSIISDHVSTHSKCLIVVQTQQLVEILLFQVEIKLLRLSASSLSSSSSRWWIRSVGRITQERLVPAGLERWGGSNRQLMLTDREGGTLA